MSVAAFLCLVTLSVEGRPVKKEKLVWYRGTCQSATVQSFAGVSPSSKTRGAKSVTAAQIKSALELLSRLPVSGEMMIKMGEETPVTRLNLMCDGTIYPVVFYGGKLKTPDTSFYSQERPDEKALFDLVQLAEKKNPAAVAPVAVSKSSQLSWYQRPCKAGTVKFIDYTTTPPKTLSKSLSPTNLEKVLQLLDRLPVSGDIMISMGPPNSMTILSLACQNSVSEIEFYDSKLKTPETSFYSPKRPEEKALLELLQQLK